MNACDRKWHRAQVDLLIRRCDVPTPTARVRRHGPLTRGEIAPHTGTPETPVDVLVSCPGCAAVTVVRLRGSHWTLSGWPDAITLHPGLAFECCGSEWDLEGGVWRQRAIFVPRPAAVFPPNGRL